MVHDDGDYGNSVDHFVSFQISRVNRLIKRQAIQILAEHSEFALIEWQVISTIAASTSNSVADLVGNAAIDKAQFSRGLALLVKRGFVEKSPHATDARTSTVRMTEQGRDAFAKIMPHMRARDQTLRAGLTAAEQRNLSRILKKIEDVI